MKKKFKLIILIISLAITSVVSVGFVDNYFEISKNIDIFTTLYKELNTFYVDETNPGELMKKGIDEMLKSLDPYTTYIPESEIEDFRFMTTGQYGGIGAMITKRGEYVFITEPYEGFPAHKAGLMAGDKILEINGETAKNKTTEEVSKILKGQPNTSVSLLIERKNRENPFSVSFERKKVSVASVPYSAYLVNGIGYIRLRSFTRNCANDLKNAIKELQKERELNGLILDLRNNPGGLLNESVDIVNLFVEKGEKVVSTKGKIKSWEKEYIANKNPLNTEVPLVVLINSSSASASEIVAGSIQDLDRGVIIGQRSYGKGLVQQTRKLSYNSQLKLTVAKYYIPSGRCIQALDYTNRNEDGSIGKVPDSLMTIFTTRNGREVKDGGGILPDIQIDAGKYSNIILSLFKERLFFDFATDFRFSNDSISDQFICSDLTYNDFTTFLLDKEYSYKTETEKSLDKLKKKAKDEKYFNGLSVEYDALVAKMNINKSDDLKKSKDDIKEILTSEILSRYYYQVGRIKGGLTFDLEVKKAISLLQNKENYYEILK
ncbi:MAG: peptidase S41 [Flavobacteriales bacterium]|nr:peptidase S41 [Flavobacteriales bacterium]|tara:strand:- start:58649 stop:60289 length:1641 start_codon:yes stop_codon:yes gene_type:complete